MAKYYVNRYQIPIRQDDDGSCHIFVKGLWRESNMARSDIEGGAADIREITEDKAMQLAAENGPK